jgi:hypothetical protein
MIADLVAGRINGALLWADRRRPRATLVRAAYGDPLAARARPPPLSYRITFGIRHNEQDWKRRLDQAIRKRQADFDRVLRDFGVPLLDDNDRLIGAPRNAAK